MRYVQEAETIMREHGLRVTPQRRAVLSYLDGNVEHPSIDEISRYVQEQMPSVSTSTIYQTMHDLEELGLVSRMDSAGIMRFDPNKTPHAHLACRKCGRIIDIPLDDTLEHAVTDTMEVNGCRVDGYHIDASGLCPSCATDTDDPEQKHEPSKG